MVKRRDEFRVVAVIKARSGDLNGGSSTVDHRLVEFARRNGSDRPGKTRPRGKR